LLFFKCWGSGVVRSEDQDQGEQHVGGPPGHDCRAEVAGDEERSLWTKRKQKVSRLNHIGVSYKRKKKASHSMFLRLKT